MKTRTLKLITTLKKYSIGLTMVRDKILYTDLVELNSNGEQVSQVQVTISLHVGIFTG